MSQEDINDGAPRHIERFIGQPKVIGPIKVALAASACGGPQFPHALFFGPGGLGKTEVARIIGHELGVQVHETLGQNLKTGDEMAGFLMSAEEKGVLFIDELHECRPKALTQLYRAMTERYVMLSRGLVGPGPVSLRLPPFTLLAATTDDFALKRPLRDRFELLLRFSFYSSAELEEIVRRRLQAAKIAFDEPLPQQIARLGKGVPRLALRLLKTCEREALSKGERTLGIAHLDQGCEHEDIEREMGLDANEQAYLKILAEDHAPVRPTVIAAQLDVSLRTVREIMEPFLLRAGLIERAGIGRILTDRGRTFCETWAAT